MKTLEEKAKEAFVILGDKYFNILKETNPRGDFKHFIKMAVEYGFRNGYREAQEWISVEDELPENETYINIKLKNGDLGSRFYESIDKDMILKTCTHWRPINND